MRCADWELLAALYAVAEQALSFVTQNAIIYSMWMGQVVLAGVGVKPASKGRIDVHAAAPLIQLTTRAGRAAQVLPEELTRACTAKSRAVSSTSCVWRRAGAPSVHPSTRIKGRCGFPATN